MKKKNKQSASTCKAGVQGIDLSPLMTRPNRVAIVALGPSCKSFVREVMSDPSMKSPFDEVWTVNRGVKGFVHDKLFVMDDFRWLEGHNEHYAEFLTNHDKPIITSTVYPEYSNAVAYPFSDVMETIGDDVFATNTISYMLAYAIHIRVKEVSIYGADFIYPNGITAEVGGMACTYLMGMMRQFDIIHRLPGDTTLLYANKVKQDPKTNTIGRSPYGYHRIEQMKKEEAKKKALEQAQQASLKG